MIDQPWQWALLAIAALGIGITKSGFAGVSMVHVLIFAHLFGARESTGLVLPLLIAGDLFAMWTYGKHAKWGFIRKMLPPALAGILLGAWMMTWLPESLYKPLIGVIILGLVGLQIIRIWKGEWLESVPHSAWFAWSMGILAGSTTMLANAAGPVFGLYLLAIGLPKMEFVGTAAWFFLLINVIKLPFSWGLGLIRVDTLWLNAILLPVVAIGLVLGKMLLKWVSQRIFDSIVLALTAAAALRMLLN
ncbi:Sulfite exporter TauE/SafE [Pirellula sp. SH-Sr6A]|uniref:sulfite exporter TauE/SafE family protein n=1 Tax=Pirellula sp. SH-Sr6A TaxID=1632865 RepID=UPI00078D57FF|nr:sulfite exporter TauE/SafE family protein [Pirellula sp. SH-Sr6A]AMV33186.1 Sulfite exporter TauE/SafE [Pirellula sp. SH-Sr6A]